MDKHIHKLTGVSAGVEPIQWSISSYRSVKTIREMEEEEKSIHPTERGRESSVTLRKQLSLRRWFHV